MTRLRDAVENLTEETPVVIRHEDGTTTAARRPVRLVTLQEEIASTMGSGGGAAGLASERNVLGTEALYKSVRIMSTIRDWCNMVGVTTARNAIVDLRAWHTAWESMTRDPITTEWHIDQLEQWANDIDAMFDRGKPLDITEPCPVCGEGKYTDTLGDVCSWPLKGYTAPFRVECLACGITWDGPDAAEELAEELGVTPV